MSDDWRRSDFESRNETVAADARTAIQTIVLINGGALAALLAFVSSQNQTSKLSIEPHQIHSSMVCFVIGVATASIASATAYLTNYAYTAQVHANIMKRSLSAARALMWAYILHWISIALVIASNISFIAGALIAAWAIT